MPPEWISIASPRMSEAITEHSICQPGRPGPHGEVHEGSPGLEAFQIAKSSGERLLEYVVKEPGGGEALTITSQEKN